MRTVGGNVYGTTVLLAYVADRSLCGLQDSWLGENDDYFFPPVGCMAPFSIMNTDQ